MRKVIVITGVVISVLSSAALFAKEQTKPPVREEGIAGGWPEITNNEGDTSKKVSEKVMMVSWGDVVFMYGPQTDAGLATQEQIQNMMRYWKNNGFNQIFWRGEDARDANFVWNESTIYAEGSFIKKEIERVMDSFDTTACAIKAAHDRGMQIYQWQSVYDDGTPANKPHRFWNDRFPWRNTFFDRHPEIEVRDRAGNVQWGVRELAYPLARQSKIEDYINVIKKYPNLDGVFIYFHTHSAAGFHGDQYGFNKPIVDEYKKWYGIDILTDPRFDYKDPNFNIHDEAVEKWRALRGEYLTQFLREMKDALKKVRPGIKIAVNTQGGDYMGPPFGNMKIDWRTWIKEGLADEIVVRTWMAGSAGAYDFGKEGYLTWGDNNVGVTPYEEIRKVINESGRDVKLITRTRAYLEGADGYYDSSNRDEGYPKKQRSVQLEQNLVKYGTIGFIEQDFENCMPLEKTGYLDYTYGGKRYFIGDMRYWASKNTSPGFAGPITTDSKQCPALVDIRKIGGKGFGIYLDEKGKVFTIARRTGSGWPDAPLSKGKVMVSFDIYKTPLKDASSSSLAITLNGKAVSDSIQLKLDDEGKLLIDSAGKWIASKYSVPNKAWTTVKMDIDFNAGTFTVVINDQKADAMTTPYDAAKGTFNGLSFRCHAGIAYLDNVKVEWSW